MIALPARRAATATALLAALLVAGCTSTPAGEEAAATVPTGSAAAVEPQDDVPPSVAPSTASWTSAPSVSDICALLTDDEVTAVIGDHVPATSATFGSLSDETGGQCVWTTDPAGDPFATDASQVELVVWVPGGVNPPPGDAPAAGDATTVPTETGIYLTAADRVLWLRVTGDAASDTAAVDAVRSLAPAVSDRL